MKSQEEIERVVWLLNALERKHRKAMENENTLIKSALGWVLEDGSFEAKAFDIIFVRNLSDMLEVNNVEELSKLKDKALENTANFLVEEMQSTLLNKMGENNG